MNPDPVFDIEHPPLLEAPYCRFPVLDLSRVPEEHRVSALERFDPATYSLSVNSAGADRIVPPGLPTPNAGPAAPRRRRQVNFRLKSEQFDDLAQAAARMNLRPTALASLLVVRGVEQILRESRGG